MLNPLLDLVGFPKGTDVLGHLARVWYMAKAMRETGALPQWFPAWYNGTPLLQYYPPLATYLMLPVQVLTDNISLTYRIFVIGCFLLGGLAAYFLARRWLSSVLATLAAGAYLANPYTLYTVFAESNMPRTFLLVIMPLMLGELLTVLERGRRSAFVSLTILTLVTVLTHQMQAVMMLSLLAIIALAYVGRDVEKRLRLLLFGLACVLGVGLAAAYLLPALTHADYPDVPNLSTFEERLPFESADWRMISPTLRLESIELVYVGLSLVVLAVVGVMLGRERRWFGLGISGLMGMFLALGVYNPLYQYLPFHTSLLPRRFWGPVILMLALLAGIGLQKLQHRLADLWPSHQRGLKAASHLSVALLAAALIALDYVPYWRLVRTSTYPEVYAALDQLNTQTLDGRLATFVDAESEWSFFPLLRGYDISDGYSIETTPHLPTILQMRLAERTGYPDFVARTLLTWNVSSILISPRYAHLLEPLNGLGYRATAQAPQELSLLTQEATSLVKVQTRNAIVIGRGAYTAVMAYPWMSWGTSWNVDDYDPAYLDQFDLIYLYDYGYRDAFELEDKARAWLKAGKTVVVDMTAMPDATLASVRPASIAVPRNPVFTAGPEADFALGEIAGQPFEYQGDAWRGMIYYNLDGTLLEVQGDDGKNWPAFGFKELPEGRLYFVGLNWMSHIVDSRDQPAMDLMDRFLQRANPNRALPLPDFPVRLTDPPADHWGFTYQSDQAAMVLVSQTWSPHWQAMLDRKPLTIYNHENLITLSLPAGEHAVEFQYASTPIQWFGWGVTLVCVAVALGLWAVYPRLRVRYTTVERQISG
jgi:uncharacterized membrane protein